MNELEAKSYLTKLGGGVPIILILAVYFSEVSAKCKIAKEVHTNSSSSFDKTANPSRERFHEILSYVFSPLIISPQFWQLNRQ